MHQFEKLKIWQKAMDIAVHVYEISLLLPNDEKFNLIHQIKKCAVSIPSNIAEGSGRNSDKEFMHFLGIANGSTFELITQLILAKRLKLVHEDVVQPTINQLVEVSNMNFSFQRSLKDKINTNIGKS
ncbi:four helix bundle protein [Flavobacterium sp. Fl-77]|uniref:Four helix bundle protein n=1 Tax=Flavobacterium flavipigmentatum TaxID=2893884 RepID=A0AAJ2SKC6_9FLAO|nr:MULTISPECIES: four helix bundle protein [unclassified Flavobacterium]MDX6184000.1 four helix bundle protein [Flavobacterium sp. Fl-33]MDX6187553.1 four helix bundle protein [Flavobacterium sp. Fl-77]UFH38446.1 four helix bundle protein [Flavobacterium sp. F-70]